MKKIFICLLVLSLLGLYGVSHGKRRVIKASELISLADASALLGQSMKEGKPDKRPFVDESKYVSKDFNFSISVWQEALHDKSSDFEKKLLKKGWASYLKEMKKAYSQNYYKQNIVEVSGIQVTSYLQDGEAMGLWLLHMFHGDYYIVVSLSNTSFSKTDNEKESAWKKEKLIESGKLAIGRLKALL